MNPIRLPRAALAAAALFGLGAIGVAQGGVYTATAVGGLQLLSAPIAGVAIAYRNAEVLNDGSATPPQSYFDNDALLIADEAGGLLDSSLVAIGDALAAGRGGAAAAASLWTEGGIAIDNATADDVEVQFLYLFDLFAEVLAQGSGASAASAFARIEIFWDLDTVVDQLLAVELGALETDQRTGSGSFSVSVPAGTTANIGMFVDVGGTAEHVPVPASLPLTIVGLALVGLLGRPGPRSP